MTAPPRADAVIIGSGFAGFSAAVRLADRGLTVVVIEEAPRLGGRATSFLDRETGERVDNGQHALFGCYRDTYAFLRRIGAADLAPLQERLTLTMADERGRTATLICPRLPAPWHLLAGLMRWNATGLGDRAGALRLAGLLRRVAKRGPAAVAAEVPPDQTVSGWLAVHGQSRALCEWLWHPLAIAALNQLPNVAAAAPFVRVLGELFAPDPAAAAIGLPTVPLDDLFAAPSAAFIEARGGAVVTRIRARIVLGADNRVVGVRAGGTVISTPTVISAVPWHAFGRIWDGEVPHVLDEIAADATAMRSSPIVTVNMWFETDVDAAMPAPFVGLVGGPMHWVFHKRSLVGGTARHLSAVASGANDLAAMDNDRITAAALEQLTHALPALGAHRFHRAVVVREQRATFSLAPGGPTRPGAATPLGGFYLAGDWTDTGLPGTIEGAVKSGLSAAAEIACS